MHELELPFSLEVRTSAQFSGVSSSSRLSACGTCLVDQKYCILYLILMKYRKNVVMRYGLPLLKYSAIILLDGWILRLSAHFNSGC